MKKILLFLAMALSGVYGMAQAPAYSIIYGPTTPAACTPATGRVFVTQTTPPVLYLCTAANTWSPLSPVIGGQLILPVGAAGTPSQTFVGDLTTGMWQPGAGQIAWSISGAQTATILANRFSLISTAQFDIGGDVILVRGGAGEIDIRNGINPQQLAVFNTYTSAASFERGSLWWSGNVFTIGTDKGGGGGVARAMALMTDGAARWDLAVAGHFTPHSDNVYDIGSPSFRVREFYVGSDINVGTTPATAGLIRVPSGGDLQIRNAPNTGNHQVSFGGANENFAIVNINKTLGAGVADGLAANLTLSPAYDQTFLVTRHNYITFSQPGLTNGATMTDAAVFRFDNVPGTHKALASPGGVAVTLGTGPTGSNAGNPLGWMKINVNGTLRYTPFW